LLQAIHAGKACPATGWVDRDVLMVSPEEPKDAKVLRTMIGGTTIHRAQL